MAKDATNIMQKVKDSESGSVSMELDDYKYGAAMLPDEDEMKQFPVRYGIVTDSNGYRVEVQETQVSWLVTKHDWWKGKGVAWG